MTVGLGRVGNGVLRLVKPGELLLWCEACECGHSFEVHALNHHGRVIGWDGDAERPSIGEPVLVQNPDGTVCEFLLRAGVMHFLQGSTHALAGQTRHLKDYPLT